MPLSQPRKHHSLLMMFPKSKMGIKMVLEVQPLYQEMPTLQTFLNQETQQSLHVDIIIKVLADMVREETSFGMAKNAISGIPKSASGSVSLAITQHKAVTMQLAHTFTQSYVTTQLVLDVVLTLTVHLSIFMALIEMQTNKFTLENSQKMETLMVLTLDVYYIPRILVKRQATV